MPQSKSIGLWVALAATLAATWYAAGIDSSGPADDELGVPARAARNPPERAPRALPTGVLPAPDASPPRVALAPGDGPKAPRAERMAPPREPLMAPRGWQPPPPPPVAAVAPPPPQAPPLPYRYLGRLEDPQGGTTVFLGEGPQARPIAVRQGDRLSQYQVEAVGANGMTLIYLPLNQKQQLLFGNTP